jgi:hypothetical protein
MVNKLVNMNKFMSFTICGPTNIKGVASREIYLMEDLLH